MNDPESCPSSEHRAKLDRLQSTLLREIPMCGHLRMQVVDLDGDCVHVAAPLEANRNHQQTAFAGSLNALCTIAGWGTVFLLLESLRLSGSIVIRRSNIRYLRPVTSPDIVARCLPIDPAALDYFAAMLAEKGQAKLDLAVEICNPGAVAVSFSGSYVVMPGGSP